MYIRKNKNSIAQLYAKTISMMLDKFMNTIFSIGAAVVIFGAWGKIEHKDFGDTALTAGLLTECCLFCAYALLEWRRRPASPSGGQPLDASQDLPSGPARPSPTGQPVTGLPAGQVEELTSTLQQTNQLLNKVFRAD